MNSSLQISNLWANKGRLALDSANCTTERKIWQQARACEIGQSYKFKSQLTKEFTLMMRF